MLGSKGGDSDTEGSIATPVATKPCVQASDNGFDYLSPLYQPLI